MKDLQLYEVQPMLKNRFSVKLLHHHTNPGYRLRPHWHENVELLFCVRGRGRFFCDDRHFDAESGDLIVVNSTEVHTAYSKDGIEFFALILYPSFFEDVDTKNLRIQSLIKQDAFVKEHFFQILQAKKEESVGSDMLMKSYAYQLFAYLFQNYATDAPSQTEQEEQAAKLKRLDAVFRYISKHYAEPIYISDLAKLCYLSDGYFCRFFKKATGRTANDYITEYRIEQAMYLLKNTENSVSEIATKTGFDDGAYFARAFRRMNGISPTEYKKQGR